MRRRPPWFLAVSALGSSAAVLLLLVHDFSSCGFYRDYVDCRQPPAPAAAAAEAAASTSASGAAAAGSGAAGPAPPSGLAARHVVYAGNEEYFQGILISMLSLLEHLSVAEGCRLHWVVSREESEKVGRVLHACLPALAGAAVMRHAQVPLPFDPKSLRGFGSYQGLARSSHTYTRLFLDSYLPTARRVLWLDADTLPRADVGPLLGLRTRFALAAAADALFTRQFNTGVLLLDLEAWRALGLAQQLAGWLRRWPDEPYTGGVHDQIALNLLFADRFERLDWRWNLIGALAPDVPRECLDGARIIHFNHGTRPGLWRSPWVWQCDLIEKSIPRHCEELNWSEACHGGQPEA